VHRGPDEGVTELRLVETAQTSGRGSETGLSRQHSRRGETARALAPDGPKPPRMTLRPSGSNVELCPAYVCEIWAAARGFTFFGARAAH
jgi:hypothetical protein